MPKNRSGDTGGENVGARIRAARLNKRLTQGQLARPDFSISYISAIERNQIQPSLRALEIIAQRLDLPSSYFFTEVSIFGQEQAGAVSKGESYHHVEAVQAQIEYTILEARVLLMEGEAEQAIALLKHLQSQTHDTRLYMRLHCQLGNAYLVAGRQSDSELELIEAEKIATHSNDTYAVLLTHWLLGQGYAARQQIERAVKEYEQCLVLFKQYDVPELFWLCDIYYILGTYYTRLGDDEKAFSMFKDAAQVAGKLAQGNYIHGALQHLSQNFARDGYPHRALLYAHKSLLEISWQIDPSFLAHMYLGLGKVMAQGNLGETHAWLEKGLARSSCKPEVRGAILVSLAGWERAHGQLEKARQQAQQAGEIVAPQGDSLVAAEAQYLLGCIAYTRDQPQEGISLCAGAIEMFQRLRLSREVIDHAEDFAQLLEQHNQPREALYYMKLAYETRGRLGM